MTFINYASREINCKIVYYGPGLGGKTTNLEYVHARTRPAMPSGVMTGMPALTPSSVPLSRKISFEFGFEPCPMTCAATVSDSICRP